MQPLEPTEQFIGKQVGRRRCMTRGLSPQNSSKANASAWRRAFGGVHVPKGVFRFRSHEEADEWLWKMITRPRQS